MTQSSPPPEEKRHIHRLEQRIAQLEQKLEHISQAAAQQIGSVEELAREIDINPSRRDVLVGGGAAGLTALGLLAATPQPARAAVPTGAVQYGQWQTGAGVTVAQIDDVTPQLEFNDFAPISGAQVSLSGELLVETPGDGLDFGVSRLGRNIDGNVANSQMEWNLSDGATNRELIFTNAAGASILQLDSANKKLSLLDMLLDFDSNTTGVDPRADTTPDEWVEVETASGTRYIDLYA